MINRKRSTTWFWKHNWLGLAACKRPEKAGKEVDKAARDIITKAGYGDCFGHGLGHSVGLFIHEVRACLPLTIPF